LGTLHFSEASPEQLRHALIEFRVRIPMMSPGHSEVMSLAVPT